MSSITSTNPSELSITKEELDSSKITINAHNSKLILENNSSDVTISKYEVPTSFSNVPSTTNSSVTMKTQVLPLVYIQNSTKIPFPAVNKTNNNVIVNNIPQFQFTTVGTNMNKNCTNISTTSVTLPTNQNVIFATGRAQPLVLQKPQGNMVPIVPVTVSTTAKITGAYLTMVKQVPKPNEPTNMNKMQLSTGNMPKMQDFFFT
ncbi:hypothetical protein NQ314_014641 [Rhamnusium bicolor]|uniref:Uncharacterized protein n=1 Tax=Rhamnusium bicolor TaxID=1586634 RepID=A0AAV8X170_9CUCU|nr:hypothetical protein NQ314_014641 [Rhamnusium bicolor]